MAPWRYLCNKKKITRWLEQIKFIFSWKKDFTCSLRSLVKYFFHSKINFICSRHRVISSIYFHLTKYTLLVCCDGYVKLDERVSLDSQYKKLKIYSLELLLIIYEVVTPSTTIYFKNTIEQYAMISRRLLWNMPSVYTKKIQVISGLFHGILRVDIEYLVQPRPFPQKVFRILI